MTQLQTIRNMATGLSKLRVGHALAMGAKCSPVPALIPTNVSSPASWISLMDFVGKGIRTSVALSREESERRQQAEAA